MAGHNKWSKVKHTKGPADAKRGKVFSKLSKELTIAAKSGGNPDLNPRLRSAMLAARAVNMPNDTLERAIKKGTGELGGAVMEEIAYEAIASGGVAFIIETATDNRNRTIQDLRQLLSKNGGSLADAGSVAYMFSRRGEIRLDQAPYTEDQATELALECGADDVAADGDDWVLYTAFDQLFAVSTALKERSATPKEPRLIYHPANTIVIDEAATAAQLVKIYDLLDDYDDTLNVFTNFELSEAASAALE